MKTGGMMLKFSYIMGIKLAGKLEDVRVK